MARGPQLSIPKDGPLTRAYAVLDLAGWTKNTNVRKPRAQVGGFVLNAARDVHRELTECTSPAEKVRAHALRAFDLLLLPRKKRGVLASSLSADEALNVQIDLNDLRADIEELLEALQTLSGHKIPADSDDSISHKIDEEPE